MSGSRIALLALSVALGGAGFLSGVGHPLASPASVPLVSLPQAELAKCRRSELLRPVCPRRVPRVSGAWRAFRARDGKLVPELQVFDLEHFAVPLRPPKGAHITVAAGAVSRLTPFSDPTGATPAARLTEAVRSSPRSQPVSFGRRTWNGQRGILYLAPAYPAGGQLGDHLVFQWRRSDKTFVVSIHSWAPLPETASTLRAMVEALA